MKPLRIVLAALVMGAAFLDVASAQQAPLFASQTPSAIALPCALANDGGLYFQANGPLYLPWVCNGRAAVPAWGAFAANGLAVSPALCTAGNVATGIGSNGNAICTSTPVSQVLNRINQSYDNTGDTTQDFKVSLKIPAGTLGANSIIDIRSTIQGSNSLGTCENDIYLSTTSNGAADGTKIGVNYTVNGQGLSAGTMVASCTNQNSVSS